jgi:nucleotide-binding universal stress UspA family protein
MLEHVLVPLDGSELAQSALDHALKLLGARGQITLVTVLEPQEIALSDFYPSTIIPRSNEDEKSTYAAIARSQNYLKRLAFDIEEEYGFHVNTRVEVGDAATLITNIAESLNLDAIVMSTHGRSGISRWLFGSVTQKVLSAAPCPVFVIPAKTHEETKSRELAKNYSS